MDYAGSAISRGEGAAVCYLRREVVGRPDHQAVPAICKVNASSS